MKVLTTIFVALSDAFSIVHVFAVAELPSAEQVHHGLAEKIPLVMVRVHCPVPGRLTLVAHVFADCELIAHEPELVI